MPRRRRKLSTGILSYHLIGVLQTGQRDGGKTIDSPSAGSLRMTTLRKLPTTAPEKILAIVKIRFTRNSLMKVNTAPGPALCLTGKNMQYRYPFLVAFSMAEFQEKSTVLHREQLTADVYPPYPAGPQDCRHAQPGQFVMVRAGEAWIRFCGDLFPSTRQRMTVRYRFCSKLSARGPGCLPGFDRGHGCRPHRSSRPWF